MRKKFISIFMAMLLVISITIPAFAETGNTKEIYDESMKIMPFVTQDIPVAVKKEAEEAFVIVEPLLYNTETYANDMETDTDDTATYTIDLDNALKVKNVYDPEDDSPTKATGIYYIFNIVSIGEFGEYVVENQMIIYYDIDNETTEYLMTLGNIMLPIPSLEEGYSAPVGNWQTYYEANIVFTEYLKSIGSTCEPVLVFDGECTFIYDPISKGIMIAEKSHQPDYSYWLNNAVFSYVDIENYIIGNSDYSTTNPKDYTSIMGLIDPIYGEKIDGTDITQTPPYQNIYRGEVIDINVGDELNPIDYNSIAPVKGEYYIDDYGTVQVVPEEVCGGTLANSKIFISFALLIPFFAFSLLAVIVVITVIVFIKIRSKKKKKNIH